MSARKNTESSKTLLITAAAAAVVTFLVFAPSLGNGFVDWDDELLLTGNYWFRGLGWENLKWMFSTFLGGLYQPLSWLSYGLDHAVWGMNASGYHLTSLLLHSANAGLAALVFGRLLNLAAPEREYKAADLALAAGFAALVFAVHPLRAESVCWATERRDVLSGFFLLLTVLFYLGGRRGRAAVAAYALSLLAKGSGAMLPLLLLVLDVYPLRRLTPEPGEWLKAEHKAVLAEKAPYAALALLAGIAGIYGQARESLMPLETHGLAARVAQFFYGLYFYAWKTLWPSKLLPLYEMPVPFDPLSARFLLPAAGVCALSLFVWKRRRDLPWGLAAWAWYGLTLLPVLGLFQFGSQLAADRYSYISCLPLAALGGAGLLAARGTAWRNTALACAAALLAAAGALTLRQAAVWRSAETLWRYTLSKEAGHLVARNNLGATLVEAGDPEGGIALYRQALELRPGYALTWNNLGVALGARGLKEEAVLHYRRAIELKPDYADARYNLANALAALGRRAEAEAEYLGALAADPGHLQAHHNLGNLYKEADRYGEAEFQYRAALQARPEHPESLFGLGTALLLQGRAVEALPPLRRALALSPGYGQASYNLATAYAALQRWAEAEAQYRETLRLDPLNADSFINLGNVCLVLGRRQEAAAHYRSALALAPGSALARANLRAALVAR